MTIAVDLGRKATKTKQTCHGSYVKLIPGIKDANTDLDPYQLWVILISVASFHPLLPSPSSSSQFVPGQQELAFIKDYLTQATRISFNKRLPC